VVESSKKRPPAERGQGRKSVSGAGKSPVFQVVVTNGQLEKIRANGGAEWVRRLIDEAK
jgi:hypothetical protein